MAVNLFLEKIKEDNELVPSFNTFYEFVQGEFRGILEEKHYREKDFDLTNFLNVLAPYYRGGEYDYLLNSDEQLDLLNKRFVVFEIDEIKDLMPLAEKMAATVCRRCHDRDLPRPRGGIVTCDGIPENLHAIRLYGVCGAA